MLFCHVHTLLSRIVERHLNYYSVKNFLGKSIFVKEQISIPMRIKKGDVDKRIDKRGNFNSQSWVNSLNSKNLFFTTKFVNN